MKTEHYNTGLSPKEVYEKFKIKDARILNLIMQYLGKSREDAVALWYNSRTRAYLVENKMCWVSDVRMLDELEMEMSGNDHWMVGSFE